jgi:hypothetical protein
VIYGFQAVGAQYTDVLVIQVFYNTLTSSNFPTSNWETFDFSFETLWWQGDDCDEFCLAIRALRGSETLSTEEKSTLARTIVPHQSNTLIGIIGLLRGARGAFLALVAMVYYGLINNHPQEVSKGWLRVS